MSSKSLKNKWNYIVCGDFGQALDKYAPIVTGIDKYTPIVTGIGQIYVDSDRHGTNIRR